MARKDFNRGEKGKCLNSRVYLNWNRTKGNLSWGVESCVRKKIFKSLLSLSGEILSLDFGLGNMGRCEHPSEPRDLFITFCLNEKFDSRYSYTFRVYPPLLTFFILG